MAQSGNKLVSVVHLVWMDYGIELFSKFLESYAQFPAGYPHDLVFLFNGVKELKDTDPYVDLARKAGLSFKTHLNYRRDQDLQAYFWVTERITTPHILFLNSYVRFLSNEWLAKYMNHSNSEEIGIIGATGSWLSYYRTVRNINPLKWQSKASLKENLIKYRTLLKAEFYWKWLFPDFPNPHIRTNAFLIRRDLMLSIRTKSLRSKFQAYLLESGLKSITRQILNKGKQVLVIDKNGNTHDPLKWPDAKVFWISDQENLLISDNQTQNYTNADSQGKKEMTANAWGIKG